MDRGAPVEVVGGDASVVIARRARELGADLIVMGTHGRTGLPRLLMGSVAEEVVRRASCPVLLVPASVLAAEAQGGAAMAVAQGGGMQRDNRTEHNTQESIAAIVRTRHHDVPGRHGVA